MSNPHLDSDQARAALLATTRTRGGLRLPAIAAALGVDVLALEAFLSGAQLSREALARLPALMTPAASVTVDALPRGNVQEPGHNDRKIKHSTPANGKPMTTTLQARALKVTAVLDPAAVVALPDPATARVTLRIHADGRTVTADIAAKSLRKAKALIAQHGAGEVAVIVQGRLVGETVTEAGLVAQVKTPKPAEPAA